MQSMAPEENERLQRLFEDSMSTLTTAVEQLSHDLSQELTLLSDAVTAIVDPCEGLHLPGTSASEVCFCQFSLFRMARPSF